MFAETQKKSGWHVFECYQKKGERFINNSFNFSDDQSTNQLLNNTLAERILYLDEGQATELEILHFRFFLLKKNSKVYICLNLEDSYENPSNTKNRVYSKENFITYSEKMNKVMDLVRKVSYVDSTVLLLGKSGVGKSAIAKRIHKYSTRKEKSFFSVNCGAIPEALIEAELFGYSDGSFTGGKKGGKKGIFESANGGTVLLDEIGEIPFHLQAKLLEVLQESRIRPVGSVHSIPVDVRVITATNQDLEYMVKERRFREDLYYRLNVVPIYIPTLAERKDDIPYLISHFLNVLNEKYGVRKTITSQAEKNFIEHDWPGNVRELENMLERLYITTEESEIHVHHLPSQLSPNLNSTFNKSSTPYFTPLKEAKKELEKDIILRAYRLYQNTYKVAEILQVNQSTIAKKVKQFRDKGEL